MVLVLIATAVTKFQRGALNIRGGKILRFSTKIDVIYNHYVMRPRSYSRGLRNTKKTCVNVNVDI